jgi:hypothetical protein
VRCCGAHSCVLGAVDDPQLYVCVCVKTFKVVCIVFRFPLDEDRA